MLYWCSTDRLVGPLRLHILGSSDRLSCSLLLASQHNIESLIPLELTTDWSKFKTEKKIHVFVNSAVRW